MRKQGEPMWQPSASHNVLKARAALLRSIREFFYQLGVREVDAPVIGACTVTDPYLEPLVVTRGSTVGYLQTSPEFFMKRMLARDAESIYFLGKAFRQDEVGRKHSPEFTMCEWYRIGFNDEALREEVFQLIRACLNALTQESHIELLPIEFRQISYQDAFSDVFGVNPHTASAEQLRSLAVNKLDVTWQDSNRNTWLDLLFSHLVEPTLTGCVCVYDYPASQSALAKVMEREDGVEVAKRFEVYMNGIELANGYWELTDPQEQRSRFAKDLAVRREQALPQPVIDEALLAAMDSGLPECAGVALGVDRLLMAFLQKDCLAEVLPFTS